LRRFFVDKIRTSGGLCSIKGSEANHIFRVLRMRQGDHFILMDAKGSHFPARIESASHREVIVTLERPLPKPPPSPVKITLCQSLIKSRQMDYLIQKASELGVDYIAPFFSKHTVVSVKRDRLANKMRHWHEIARNSAKQSCRGTPAEIDTIRPLEKLVVKLKSTNSLKVILWEEEKSRDLKGLLRTSSPISKFVGMVGPEGGFSQQEIEVVRAAGFFPVSMGNRILRAETAAITLVGIVQYECGDLGLT